MALLSVPSHPHRNALSCPSLSQNYPSLDPSSSCRICRVVGSGVRVVRTAVLCVCCLQPAVLVRARVLPCQLTSLHQASGPEALRLSSRLSLSGTVVPNVRPHTCTVSELECPILHRIRTLSGPYAPVSRPSLITQSLCAIMAGGREARSGAFPAVCRRGPGLRGIGRRAAAPLTWSGIMPPRAATPLPFPPTSDVCAQHLLWLLASAACVLSSPQRGCRSRTWERGEVQPCQLSRGRALDPRRPHVSPYAVRGTQHTHRPPHGERLREAQGLRCQVRGDAPATVRAPRGAHFARGVTAPGFDEVRLLSVDRHVQTRCARMRRWRARAPVYRAP
ncbi:hypothetical protein BC628DRAFT_245205 [Trametes gibbosa]|nr:hypothetical protein BC628DRAFT_245205 [Trametes gibbosa]